MSARLVFMGPPGTGKGTQAKRACDSHDLTHLSSGDTLRAEMAIGSDVGRRAESHVKSGGLVPDELVSAIMLAGIGRLPPARGFILDGFPRTPPQAETLEAGLASRGGLHAVLNFSLDDREIVQRIAGRLVCSLCGAAYNARFLPPKTAGRCDRCDGALIQRPDDRESVVMTRLATYRQETAPLIDFYRARGLLREIDASRAVEQVAKDVTGVLASLSGTR